MSAVGEPGPIDPTLVAVVLAAGSATRFAGPTHKLLVELRGRRLIDHCIAAPLDAGFELVVVVQGAVDLGLTGMGSSGGRVVVISNPEHAAGQATSLVAGVEWARAHDARGVVVGLGDAPFVGAEAWRRVARQPGELVVATYDGVDSPPVKIMGPQWPSLPRTGDEGARRLIRLRPDVVIRVPCRGLAVDIDTGEDLARWS